MTTFRFIIAILSVCAIVQCQNETSTSSATPSESQNATVTSIDEVPTEVNQTSAETPSNATIVEEIPTATNTPVVEEPPSTIAASNETDAISPTVASETEAPSQATTLATESGSENFTASPEVTTTVGVNLTMENCEDEEETTTIVKFDDDVVFNTTENFTMPNSEDQKHCLDVFESVLAKQNVLRRKLKGQLAEHDLDQDCHFDFRAKKSFHKFYYDTLHLLPAEVSGKQPGHHSELFKHAMLINFYSRITTIFLDRLRDKNITLSRNLENLILEVVQDCKAVRQDPCYGKAYLENCRDVIEHVWHPFLASIKMEYTSDHDQMRKYFSKQIEKIVELIPSK